MNYGFPVLGRTGLGNMLTVWAKCRLWCFLNDAPMIAPYWAQVRIGTYLRRERDKRHYQSCFNDDHYISGLLRKYLLLTKPKLHVDTVSNANAAVSETSKDTVFCFEGLGGFEDLTSHSEFLKNELLAITDKRLYPGEDKSFIGVHIRRGDYREIPPDCDPSRYMYYRLPIDWYVDAVCYLRSRVGDDVPVCVFSDGTEDELAPIMGLPAVKRSAYKHAITDILAMSNASVIVASRSTFSAWSVFLGQVPAVWYPGTRQAHLIPDDRDELTQQCWLPEQELSEEFIASVKARLVFSGQ